MLFSEFVNLTDIHPDALLYEAIEEEYNRGGWDSKAQFCHAYKFNDDGLATKCQTVANERLTRLYEGEAKLKNEIRVLESRLRATEQDMGTTISTMKSMQQDDLKVRMLDALIEAANGDATPDMILHMVFGFEYLLDGAEKEAK